MGWDIHLYVEKQNADGIWENVICDPNMMGRDYSLFQELAGVPCDWNKEWKHPHELTESDVDSLSHVTQESIEGLHHFVMYTYRELAAMLPRIVSNIYSDEIFKFMVEVASAIDETEEERCRILIGFDS